MSATAPQGEWDPHFFPPSATGDEGRSCGQKEKRGRKGILGWLGSKNWAPPEKWSKTSRGEGKNIRWAPGQTIFQYASVRASCQTTPLNSCSPTANKTVLFASGFWPQAVSTAPLPAAAGTYCCPLTPTGWLELARVAGGTPCAWDEPPLHTRLCTLAPAQQSGGCCAGTHSFALGASNEPPPKHGEPHMPPPTRQCREEWRRRSAPGGGIQRLPLRLPGRQQPCPVSNMQFAPWV